MNVVYLYKGETDKVQETMKIMKIPTKGGDEFEALSKYRKYVRWKRGELKKIKRAYSKRLRKYMRLKHD